MVKVVNGSQLIEAGISEQLDEGEHHRRSRAWFQPPWSHSSHRNQRRRLGQIRRLSEHYLVSSAEKGTLASALETALGVPPQNQDAEDLVRAWTTGGAVASRWRMPSIQLVSSTTLGGAMGAYVKDLNRILINSDWMATASNAEVMAVLLEEYGHFLDPRFHGATDTPRDEGEIFADVLLDRLKSDPDAYADDAIEVVIRKKTHTAEAASFSGSAGNDYLYPASTSYPNGITNDAADSLSGGAGNDTLDGGYGQTATTAADTLYGGAGDDVFIADFVDVVQEDSLAGTDSVRFRNYANQAWATSNARWVYTLPANVENLSAQFPGTVISGSEAAVTSTARGVRFRGNALDNSITGTSMDDVIGGGAGNDTLDGGLGIDLIDFGTSTAGVSFTLSQSTTSYSSTGAITNLGTDQYINFEGIVGSAYGDTLTGSSAADYLLQSPIGQQNLTSAGVRDVLSGGGGNDQYQVSEPTVVTISDSGGSADVLFLTSSSARSFTNTTSTGLEILALDPLSTISSGFTGGDGNETIYGSIGANTISGGLGNDQIFGTPKAQAGQPAEIPGDKLTGNSGNDTFAYFDIVRRPLSITTAPVILDINDVSGIQYVGLSANVRFDYTGDSKGEVTAWVGKEKGAKNGVDGILVRDANGNGKPDGASEIAFTNNTNTSKTDLEGLRLSFDTNNNGILERTDSKWNKFYVWQDNNINGIYDNGDTFRSLDSVGITSINLTSDQIPSTAAGGEVTIYGTTTYLINGQTRNAQDVRFATGLPTNTTVDQFDLNYTSTEQDTILLLNFPWTGGFLDDSEVKVYVTGAAGDFGFDLPLQQGYNIVWNYNQSSPAFIYYENDEARYGSDSNRSKFISDSTFSSSITAASDADLKTALEKAILAINDPTTPPVTPSPAATGTGSVANSAPNIRVPLISGDTVSYPDSLQGAVTRSVGENDSISGLLNVVDVDDMQRVAVSVDAAVVSTVTPGTLSFPAGFNPLSLLTLRGGPNLSYTDLQTLDADTIVGGTDIGWRFNAQASTALDWLPAGATLSLGYTLRATDNDSSNPLSDTQGVTVSVTGVNDAAVIGAPTVSSVTEDVNVTSGNLTVIGTIPISDPDSGEASFRSSVTSADGNLGSLSLATSGAYTYTVANSAVQSLRGGATRTDSFTVSAFDGTSKTILFTITGTDDRAVIGDPTVSSVTEDVNVTSGNLTAAGILPISDVDVGDTPAFSTSVIGTNGNLGSLSLATSGAYTYTVANNTVQYLGSGVTKTDSFTVSATDGTSKTVLFTIIGTDDPAVIGDPSVNSVTEDENVTNGNLTAQGSIAISDPDTGEAAFSSVSGIGNLGSLSLAANGAYTYTVANSAVQSLRGGATRTDSFSVTSAGGTSRQVAFTIIGRNDGPVLSDTTDPAPVAESATNATTQVLAPITGSFAVSDADVGDRLTPSVVGNPSVRLNGSAFTLPTGAAALTAAGAFSWTPPTSTSNGGTTGVGYTYDPGTVNLAFLGAGQNLTITYTVKVSDGVAESGTQDVTFTITGIGGIDGTEGDDTLVGTDSRDAINGFGGNDSLIGLSAQDTLWGGSGNDTLTGGNGPDIFLWKAGDQGSTTNPAQDTIIGFDSNSAGNIDVVNLKNMLVNEPTSASGLNNTFLNFSFDGSNTVLKINTVGNLASGFDQSIIFSNTNLFSTLGVPNNDSLGLLGKMLAGSNPALIVGGS